MRSTLIAGAVGVLLGGFASCGGRERKPPVAPARAPAPMRARAALGDPARRVATIARRVEALRGLHFRRVPVPRLVTALQARRDGLAELDKSSSLRLLRTNEELLELLGLVPAQTDLRRLESSVFGEQVAGFYDTRRKRLAIVRGPAAGGGDLDDVTLAHELTHALEDQRFQLHEPKTGTDDTSTAHTALLEGTATEVMLRYTQRHVSPGRALSGALGALGAAKGSAKLPPYINSSLLFPYLGGDRFVQALYRYAGGWRLVNLALRYRPPASSEQVLHPEKWLRVEQPLPVTVHAGRVLRAGWRRIGTGSVGEWDTEQLLRRGEVASASPGAAGWGGSRYELWRRGPLPDRGCPAPCRGRDALVLVWRWDTARDAAEFDAALPPYIERGLHGAATGPLGWRLGSGAARLVTDPKRTALILAPTPRLADRLARAER